MTKPDDIAILAGKLTEAQRRALSSIHPRFGVKDIWRPNEGESHVPYSALVRAGLLEKRRCGDFPMIYWLTEKGAALRSHMNEQGEREDG